MADLRLDIVAFAWLNVGPLGWKVFGSSLVHGKVGQAPVEVKPHQVQRMHLGLAVLQGKVRRACDAMVFAPECLDVSPACPMCMGMRSPDHCLAEFGGRRCVQFVCCKVIRNVVCLF